LSGAPFLQRSFATGDVTSSGAAGGLVSFTESGAVSDSYATGTASAPVAGGLVGYNMSVVESHSVGRSYSMGAVTGSSGSTGGLIGVDSQPSTIKHAYWNTTTSRIANKAQGAGNVEDDSGIRGFSNKKLQSGLPCGFNPRVWTENGNINGGLPYLIANPPQN
jgi:hypothetical protein